MMRKDRLFAACIVLLLCVGCVHAWSGKLAYLPEEKWMDSDRRALLLNSPWVESGDFPVNGWPGEMAIVVQATASWLSPYFVHMRRVIMEGMDGRLPLILDFDSPQGKDAFSKGRLQLAEASPYPLDRSLVLKAPMVQGGLGQWPSSAKAAVEANRQLFIPPPSLEDLELHLGGQIQLVDTIMIDLTLWPQLRGLEQTARQEALDCLARIQGHLLMRGAELIRDDQTIMRPWKVIVLGHDVGGAWSRAVMAADREIDLAAAPTVARLFFKQEEGEKAWPDEEQKKALLHLSLPKDLPVDCAFDEAAALKLEIELSFDFGAMRVTDAWGI